jgi:hypothetical protein
MAALGDTIYRGSSVWKRLPGNITVARKLLRQTGTGSVSAAPSWEAHSAVVTLTDAQVKALPTTAITLVANQGSGLVVNWTHADLFAKFASGAYTNVNTTFAYLNIGAAGGAQASLGIANDSTTTPAITQATTFFGAASKRARMLPYMVAVPVAASSGYILTSSEDGTFALDAFADLNDTGIALTMDNNGSGNLTGGNAANVLKIVVYYSVESLP